MSTARAAARAAVPLLLVAAGLLPAAAPPASAASGGDAPPTATVTVTMPAPQRLSVDPGDVTKRVVADVSDCSLGCTLTRRTTIRASVRDEVLVRQAPRPGPARLTASDRIETPLVPGFSSYVVTAVVDDPDIGPWESDVASTPSASGYADQESFSWNGSWSAVVDLAATETLVRRSVTPGDAARWTVPGRDPSHAVTVGVVTARGPGAGVLAVDVDGVRVRTVDLRSAGVRPRLLAAVVPAREGSVVVVRNVTPAGRAQREVRLDGVTTLGTRYAVLPASEVATAPLEPPAVPGVEVLPAVGSVLAATPRSIAVDVVGRSDWCATGCTIALDGRTFPPSSTPLLEWTAPSSSSVQTRSVRRTLTPTSLDAFVLEQGRDRVAGTPVLSGRYLAETVVQASDGWTRHVAAQAVSGSVLRTATRGAGVTYRVTSATVGRALGVVARTGPDAGVLAVLVNGTLVETVDLRAPSSSPRTVVASVTVPNHGRITLVNRTPAERAGAVVDLDGLVLVDAPDDVA